MDWISALIKLVQQVVVSIEQGVVENTKERMKTLREIYTDTNETVRYTHHKQYNSIGFYIIAGLLVVGLVFIVAVKKK